VSRHALCIRHIAFEDLSAWRQPLEDDGFAITYVDAGVDSLPPDPLAPDLLIVLGGPMGVYERDAYPFLRDEIAFIARRIPARASIPPASPRSASCPSSSPKPVLTHAWACSTTNR
jgi:GMP synthase (glutamine-hydrolysing)